MSDINTSSSNVAEINIKTSKPIINKRTINIVKALANLQLLCISADNANDNAKLIEIKNILLSAVTQCNNIFYEVKDKFDGSEQF